MEYKLKYGTLQTGIPYRSHENTWFRIDKYISNENMEVFNERAFCSGPDDKSARHGDNGERYNPKCSCCWLNFIHTNERHELNIK